IIVGSGREYKRLKQQVAQLELTEKVFFTKHLNNPFPVLRASDCLVLPSQYEGQGLVLLEALTLGKYCIASDLPATREILKEGYGQLVSPTVIELSDALYQFCIDPKK